MRDYKRFIFRIQNSNTLLPYRLSLNDEYTALAKVAFITFQNKNNRKKVYDDAI